MGIAAALGVSAVAGIAGSALSANGAESAAKTQANAANEAAATQLNMFNQTRTSLEPFIGAGSSAISQLANIFGFGNGTNGTGVGSAGGTGFNPTTALSQLTQTPGYQFGLQQGGQALDRSAASRGLLLSGAQLQDSQKFGTDYATQQAYNPYISELNTITGVGENAAAGVGNNATTAANGIAASQLAAGQATASGQVATGNILGQATTQLLSGSGSSYGVSGLAALNPANATGYGYNFGAPDTPESVYGLTDG